jgi:hypothetical protein
MTCLKVTRAASAQSSSRNDFKAPDGVGVNFMYSSFEGLEVRWESYPDEAKRYKAIVTPICNVIALLQRGNEGEE